MKPFRKITPKDLRRIQRKLGGAQLLDPRLYHARRNLLKAYRRLCAPTNMNDLGHARAHACDAVDLLNIIMGLEEEP
jgi:hypothetical protein